MTTREEHRKAAADCYQGSVEAIQVLRGQVQGDDPVTDADINAALASAQVSATLGLLQATLALTADD